MKKILILISLLFTALVSNAQCETTTSLAGSGVAGFINAIGVSAQFNIPDGVAVDGSGNVYVADRNNHRIRKISPSGVVTTLAGSGIYGYADGAGISAQFGFPSNVAVDASGNVYVTDQGNHRIRKITSSGAVTTIAGSGVGGFTDGTGTATQFNAPIGITIDNSGNVYVADWGNHKIRKITSSGVVTTLAGSGVAGYADGSGTAAQFNRPTGVVVDASGNLYVTDSSNHRIRKVNSTGIVTTIAGTGIQGSIDGTAISARFNFPDGISVDTSGNIYIADRNNNKIRKISSNRMVSTIAGSGATGFMDGIGTATQFSAPLGIGVDAMGIVYVGDSNNNRIRKITPLSVSLNYSSLAFCITQFTAQSPILTGTGSYLGGVFSSTPGISINSVTGAIIPNTSNPGTYVVTYSTPLSNGCQISATTQVTIVPNSSANISYSGSPFCKSIVTKAVTLTGTGTYTGGNFSSSTGLIINSSTGVINPSTSTPGTYTVTYSVSSGCQISTSTQVTIIAPNTNAPTANISYLPNSSSPQFACLATCIPYENVALTGSGSYQGGLFSSEPPGLSIDSSTGRIFPEQSQSDLGTYTIYYNLPSNLGCLASTVSCYVNIVNIFDFYTPFHYSSDTFCNTISSPQAPIANSGQTFQNGFFTSSPSGLSLDFSSGNIIPSLSTPGSYVVKYNRPNNCGFTSYGHSYCDNTTYYQITITAMPTVNINYPSSPYYNLNSTPQPVSILGTGAYTTGNYSSTVGLNINPSTGAITPSSSTPGIYTVTYTIPANQCWPAVIATTQVVISTQPNIGTISLSSSNSGTIGLFDTITVNVQLTNATDLYSLYMKLKGNAAVSQYLDYSTYTAGNLLGTSNVISTPPTVTNGVPDFGMTKVGAIPGYSGTGLFYTFKFVPKNISIPNGTIFCFYLDDVNTYNSAGTACSLTNQGQICFTFSNQIKVWPGDLNNSNVVTTADLLPIGYFYNSTGPVRPSATIQWNAQPATLWGFNRSTMSGSAYKTFADSNGDGVINNADQAAIGFNMNQVHTRQANRKPFGIAPNTSNNAQVQGALNVTPNVSIINGAVLPQTVTFTVNLTNTGGLSSLYGISVNLIFDNTIFDLSTATINYTGSIFGNVGTDCLAMNYNSASGVSVGLTRYANAAINGQGLLFKVTLQTKTTLPNLTQTEVISYVDSANNQLGNPLEIGDSTPINFSVINVNLSLNDIVLNTFKLYPNPSKGILYFSVGDSYMDFQELKLKIVNTLGQVIDQISVKSATEEIITKNWGGSGMYFVQIETTQGEILGVKKIILQ
jgi:sugar lactone lactonase YvrE